MDVDRLEALAKSLRLLHEQALAFPNDTAGRGLLAGVILALADLGRHEADKLSERERNAAETRQMIAEVIAASRRVLGSDRDKLQALRMAISRWMTTKTAVSRRTAKEMSQILAETEPTLWP